MATYIQGQTDYISQIQPTEPNLAFDAQILQTKQAKYDANHKKVSDLYGSLLNSSLTRSDNIQARDEFFQIINDDIRRMGGLDFSLDQNVQAAASVFQSIYENKNIVKDMVWTKNYNNETNRMESFKNCLDEEKCGGLYWEEGDKFMQYKRMEYKNASAGDALGMADVKFTPYKNVMKEAIKLAKDAGLTIELDQLSQDGNYIVTTKNGMKLKSPLTALFNKTIGQNPQYAEMFKTKAYVDRNDWAYGKVNMGEYKDVNEAQLGYLREVTKRSQAKLEQQADDLNVDIANLDQKARELEEEYKNGRFVEGSEKYNMLVELKELQQGANNAKAYLDQVNSIEPTNFAAIETLTDNMDNQNAYSLFNAEIDDAAQTLAFKDYKVSMKADDFAKMKTENKYKLQQMATQHQYDMDEESQKQQGRIDLENHKKTIGHSSYTGGGGKDMLNKSNDYIVKKDAVENFDLDAESRKNMKDLGFGTDIPTADEVATWKNAVETNDDSNEGQKMQGKWKKYQKAQKAAQQEYDKMQREANKAAVAYGEIPKFREVMTASDISEYGNKYDWDYQEAWLTNTYNNLAATYKQKYGKPLTMERYQGAIKSADETKPLIDELKTNLKLD
jgi:hypothetical protein